MELYFIGPCTSFIGCYKQGGVLSPLLLSAFVDVIGLLRALEKSKYGCFIKGNCVNSFLYADDLLLLSISVSDLQLMIDKCIYVLNGLDLQLNSSKSFCMRIW